MATRNPQLPPLTVVSPHGVRIAQEQARGGEPPRTRVPEPSVSEKLLSRPAEPIVPVHLPGGEGLTKLQETAYTTIEHEFKVLPEDSWFDPGLSPQRPVQFELGSFVVPKGQHFWVFDYTFVPYVFSGIDPSDAVPAEDGRFSTIMGFDLTVNGRRLSNLLFQLDPVPVQLQRTAALSIGSAVQRAPTLEFNKQATQSFAANASPGLALLPCRRRRQGATEASGIPFTWVAKEEDRVALSTVIFKPVPAPLACIEGRVAGYLVQTALSFHLLDELRVR